MQPSASGRRAGSTLAVLLLVACGGSTSPQPTPPVANAAPADAAQAPTSDVDLTAASNGFLDLVGGSRSRIQRCYEHALKTSAELQSQAVTLTIVADFADGKTVKLTSAPALGAAFEQCLTAIAAGWQLAVPTTMTFKARVLLTPTP